MRRAIKLKGRFGNTSDSPFVEGYIEFPQLSTSAQISFLVDTGAKRSVIMPADAQLSQINYHQLTPASFVQGIGGKIDVFEEEAYLAFVVPNRAIYIYQRKILIAPLVKHLQKVPSIIGRDIINHWRMTYDYPKQHLSFEVLAADQEELLEKGR